MSGNCSEGGQTAIAAVTFFESVQREKVSGAVKGVKVVGTVVIPNRKAMRSIGQVVSVFPQSPEEKEGTGKVQEAIQRLQDEVRILQEELTRTRRGLDQREMLLRNSRQRESELRAEVGAG